MSIVRTEFTLSTTDESFAIPGDVSAEQIVTNYATQFPALRTMTNTSSVVTVEGVGEVRKIIFSPRTGTKG